MTADGTIRVLLVDDHKSFLWGLTKLVEGERPRMEVVGTASTRTEALTLAAERRSNVILLDIDLGDGVKSLEFLPDLLREADARVLILTGARERDTHDLAVERGAHGLDELTPAELRVIEEVVKQSSSTSKQIADSLHMTVKTLNNHLTSIYSKLGVKSRLELFIYALKRGLAKLS